MAVVVTAFNFVLSISISIPYAHSYVVFAVLAHTHTYDTDVVDKKNGGKNTTNYNFHNGPCAMRLKKCRRNALKEKNAQNK